MENIFHAPLRTKKGQIQLIFGPMFSGKSSELMRRIVRYQYANKKCLAVKYAKDTRYHDNAMATHDQRTIEALSVMNLGALRGEKLDDVDVIGIDEGQFYPDCIQFAEDMARKGKIVIIAALDGDYRRQGFNKITDLVPLAESVIKLNAVCMICGDDAAFTKRIEQNEHRLELIGGADTYLASCRDCFEKKGEDMKIRKKAPLAVANINILEANN